MKNIKPWFIGGLGLLLAAAFISGVSIFGFGVILPYLIEMGIKAATHINWNVTATSVILILVAILLYINYKKMLKPTWGERLREIVIGDRTTMREMHILSATYGMCEIGELFGSLKEIREKVAGEVFLEIVNFHKKFSNGINKMYNATFYAKQLKLMPEKAAQEFEDGKHDALYAYNRLIEIKREHNIDWVDPLLVAMPSPYMA